jgi:hypothetical protein
MSAAKPRRGLRFLRRLAVYLLVGYLLVVAVYWLLENHLVFQPDTAAEHWRDPEDPRIQDVWFDAADGHRIHAWFLPHADSRDSVILCHGNGGNLSPRSKTMLRMHDHLRRNVLIFDYPGYGKSTGDPNEASCYASADAAYDWLTKEKGLPASRVLLYGESLGSGVAVELATKREHQAVVLAKPFTSLPAAAKYHYPWLPAYLLMTNRFDNLRKIKSVHTPVFVAGGTADRVIPFAQSEV